MLILAGAFAVTRVMKTLLFGVDARDPVTFIVVPLVLAAAASLPATYRRAARRKSIQWQRCALSESENYGL
jgi:hypothetical protein